MKNLLLNYSIPLRTLPVLGQALFPVAIFPVSFCGIPPFTTLDTRRCKTFNLASTTEV
jgi:hypothetical protein